MQNKDQLTVKKTILLFEDSYEDAELIRNILSVGTPDFEVHHTADYQVFTRALIDLKPDLIISDFMFPDFNGFEALLSSRKTFPEIPFIFVTGAVGEEMAAEALNSGATDFILKNNLGRLVPAVTRALSESSREQERKKLYHNLIISEKRYRTLMENIPVGLFRTSFTTPGRIFQANPAFAHIFNFDTLDQVLNTPAEDLYCNPGDRTVLLSAFAENNRIERRLMRYKKNTGEPFWGSISASCHLDRSGNPDWIDGVIEDVTEKMEIENMLRTNLKFLETLIDSVNSPVYYKDINGVYQGCNKAFADQIMGLPREKIVNKTVFDLADAIPVELAEEYVSMDAKLLNNPGVQIYDSKIKCNDGITRFFHFNKTTYNNQEGDVAGIVGIMVDVTERVENEMELKRINEELDLLINSLSSLIIGVSIKDRITHWNPFAEKIFGIKAGNIIGRSFSVSGIKWDWTLVYEAISDCIIGDRSIRLDDLTFENAHGQDGILGITVNPLKRGGDLLEGFIILGKDLTEQKIMESQLLQSNKLEAIGQLAAGVAHEINTPMQYVGDNLKFINKSFVGLFNMLDIYERAQQRINDFTSLSTIFGQADELAKKVKLPFLLEQIPKALDQSLEGVARVSSIIQSMKAFSHPGTGLKMPADINKAIENTVTVSRNEWKYDCDLELDLDKNLPEVPCFESELNQVLLNLIVNATDSVREAKEKNLIESGLIKIRTYRDSSYFVIEVKDNGMGIPDAIKDRIFNPFFTTKDVGKGTGQGLAISHSIIVEKHNGLLYFKNEPVHGAAFIIKLPFEEMV